MIVFPPNSPAPGRTCPHDGDKTIVFGGAITCVKGIWVTDPGQIFKQDAGTSTPTPTPVPTPSTTSSTSGSMFDSDGIATIANNDVQQIL